MKKLFQKKEQVLPKNRHEYLYSYSFPVVGFGLTIVLAVLIYGFFVAPCSFEISGKASGKLEMQNPLVSNDSIVVNQFEGKISGTGPCVAVLSLGFNQKVTTTPESKPIKSFPSPSSLSPVGEI